SGGHGGRGGRGLTGETEQRRLNGEDTSPSIDLLNCWFFSVPSPFLRSSCTSVSVTIVAIHFSRRYMLDKAQRLRELHQGPPILVLPNAWDAASARIFEREGFRAIATASAAVAAALGYPDGGVVPA